MKVKIGKYKEYFGVWDLSSKFFEWGFISQETHGQLGKYLEKKSNWIRKFLDWIYAIRKRKVVVKIDDYDTWNLEHTLALIIVPSLKKFKEGIQGVPSLSLDEDVPDNLKIGDNQESYEKSTIQWNYIIDEMIWAFDYSLQFDKPLFDADNEARQANGLRLFAKYYNCLWN